MAPIARTEILKTLLPSSAFKPTAASRLFLPRTSEGNYLNCTTLARLLFTTGHSLFIVRVEYIKVVEVGGAGRVKDLQHVCQLGLGAGRRGVGARRARVAAGGGRTTAAALGAEAAVLPHAWGRRGT